MITGILSGLLIFFSIVVVFEAVLMVVNGMNKRGKSANLLFFLAVSILAPMAIWTCCWEFPQSTVARFFGLTF
jgi:hypothetical protein